MALRVRMAVALVLAVVAVVIFALYAPEHFSAVARAAARHAPAPKMPGQLALGALAGFVSWVLAVHEQWRRRAYGWIVASFLLSYAAVISFCVTALANSRDVTSDA